jgi:hypothetical protein
VRERVEAQAAARIVVDLAIASDAERGRKVRLLLLSKAAVLAPWCDRPLAAGMDESQQHDDGATHSASVGAG